MKESLLNPTNLLRYVIVVIYCVLPFVSPVYMDYQLRVVLQTTFIGVMLLPTYLLYRQNKVSIKFMWKEILLYTVFLSLIYLNTLRPDNATLRIAMISGRVPAFLGLQTYIYIGIFFLVTSIYFRKIFNRTIMDIIYISHIIVGVIMIIVDQVNPYTIMYGFGNPNYATEPFAILYIILVFSMVKKELNVKYLIISTLLLLITFYVNVTGMRLTIFISFMTTMLIYFFTKEGNRGTVIILTSVFLVLFIGSGLIFQFDWLGRAGDYVSGDVTLNALSSGRLKLWSDIYYMTTASTRSIITGIGPSMYYYFGASNFNAHNMVVEVFASSGVIGLITIATMTVIMIINSIKVVQLNKNYWVIGYWLFILVKWNLNSMMILTSIYYLMMLAQIYNIYKEDIYEVN